MRLTLLNHLRSPPTEDAPARRKDLRAPSVAVGKTPGTVDGLLDAPPPLFAEEFVTCGDEAVETAAFGNRAALFEKPAFGEAGITAVDALDEADSGELMVVNEVGDESDEFDSTSSQTMRKDRHWPRRHWSADGGRAESEPTSCCRD